MLSTWFNNTDNYGDDSFNYSSNDEEPKAVDSAIDIKDYPLQSCSDHIKYQLILNREPDVNFKFPANQYKDKRSKSGYMNRFCCRSWLKRFDYTCYSKGTDGFYCLACVLFPDLTHRWPNKLIIEPYQNWKDAVEEDALLDIQLCRSQTMDGAGNMDGKQAGCAARFTKQSRKAVYHYCSSPDLNLALCKCCQLKEVYIMSDTLKQLGLFF